MNISFPSARLQGVDPISVLLIDSQSLLRRGVASLIDVEPDMRVAGQADDASNWSELCNQLRPDVVCVDLELLDSQPSDVIRQMRALPGSPKVLILTHRSCEEDVYRAMCGGANAYLFKSSSSDDLLRCIRAIRLGGTYVPPPVAAKLSARLMGGTLSPREMDVLKFVAAGHSNKLIGRQFGISDGTVKAHTKRIFAKLGVSSRTGAVATAVQRGLINF
ncbi:MAG: response regulator transcription factor [Polaromonas sp.]|nr:response regulator transcription factor [Polaromonas sp.]